ncbi:reverse transcriptase domain-containing protein [Tanacetum coccineum]
MEGGRDVHDLKPTPMQISSEVYPLPEINWKIESLMGFQYKCFLDAYKGYYQIQMTKKDEENTAFHMKEGVFCYTKMPFGLKNAGATYQRLVDSAFKEGRNKLCSDGKTHSGSPRSQTIKEVFPSSPDQGAYGITYVPRVAVKGQVLADFLADTPTEINATPEVASTPRMEDIPESSNARENLTPGPRAWRLYTDEASNNGGSRAGLILIAPDDVEYSYALRLNFSNSNNEAEYEALLAGLRIAIEMQVKDIHAFVDSKLVASQVEGSYEAKGERMIKYQEKVLELAGAFNRFRITHIPRAENRKTDALSKLAVVQFDHLSKKVLVEALNESSVEAQEVNMVVKEEGPTWMTLI